MFAAATPLRIATCVLLFIAMILFTAGSASDWVTQQVEQGLITENNSPTSTTSHGPIIEPTYSSGYIDYSEYSIRPYPSSPDQEIDGTGELSGLKLSIKLWSSENSSDDSKWNTIKAFDMITLVVCGVLLILSIVFNIGNMSNPLMYLGAKAIAVFCFVCAIITIAATVVFIEQNFYVESFPARIGLKVRVAAGFYVFVTGCISFLAALVCSFMGWKCEKNEGEIVQV